MAVRHKAIAVLIAATSACLAATGTSRAEEITLYRPGRPPWSSRSLRPSRKPAASR
ncbi:hypothetical protein ACQ5SK_16595 [Bradyrhizobium japonicum]